MLDQAELLGGMLTGLSSAMSEMEAQRKLDAYPPRLLSATPNTTCFALLRFSRGCSLFK